MTTAEQTEEMTSDDVLGADAAPRGGELARRPERTGLGAFQLAVRRMLGLEDASDGEIELFWHLSQKSGLDPFNREIYMIGRNTEVASYEPVNPDEPDGQKRKVVRWVTKYTVQVAINGFRKRAREIADAKGIDLEMGEPLWCGDDAVWRQVLADKPNPMAAKFTVYRDGKAFPFIAHFSEFAQYSGQGNLTSMWTKMPRNQIRKCAEANAIQMAFPDELGGLILEDAAQPDIIIDSDGNPDAKSTSRPAQRARGTAGLRDAAAADTPEAPETEQPESVDQQRMSESARRKWLNRMFALLGEADCNDREDQLIVLRHISTDHAIEHRDAISDDHLRAIVNQMNAWTKAGEIGDKITDILNTATLAAAAETEKKEQQNG